MSTFDLQASLERAEKRLATVPRRRPRSDRGRPRLAPDLAARLEELLGGQERPPVREIREDLAELCRSLGTKPPARATIYQAMARLPAGSYPVATLPRAVRQALYNLSLDGQVPGHQLAFHCFNYGGPEAVSFAAGLPWLALYQAARLPGWRPKSRGLLEAVRKVRRI